MTVIPNNKHDCNVEFKKKVNARLFKLINKGFIISSVKFTNDEFNRYKGVIIEYKKKEHN